MCIRKQSVLLVTVAQKKAKTKITNRRVTFEWLSFGLGNGLD